LKGLDNNLFENLESSFKQDYPNFEILLSVADERDEALPVVRELISLYPNVNARVIIGALLQGYVGKLIVINAVQATRNLVSTPRSTI
jgi:ceramide glucosyltransferase